MSLTTKISVLNLLFFILSQFVPFSSSSKELSITTLKRPRVCSETAEKGDFLRVHYEGKLENGSVFDASRNRGNTFDFELGAGQVIRGYELGVPGMCVGETRSLIVPPHLAYGDDGITSVIPPRSTLYFDVELIQLIKS